MEKPSPQLRHQLAQFQQAQQQAQVLMTQRQQLELLLRETERALEELGKLQEGAAVYKSVGTILVKSEREELKKSLGEQKETLDLRIKTLERQEERVVQRLREMREKLEEAGFEVRILTHFMAALVLPLLVARGLSRLRPSSRRRHLNPQALEFRVVPVLNGLLKSLLSLERALLAQSDLRLDPARYSPKLIRLFEEVRGGEGPPP